MYIFILNRYVPTCRVSSVALTIVICIIYTLTITEAQATTIDIANNPRTIINKEILTSPFGFNSNFFRSPESIGDPILWKRFNELQAPLLRFPGGLANWYNWENGRIETTNRSVLDYMKGGVFREIPLEEMIQIATKYKIQLLYVINVYDSLEKIQGLVKTLVHSKIVLRGIEIGNEVYTKSFADELGGASGYLQKVRWIKLILRRNGYNGPIGVNIAPVWTPGQGKHVHLEQMQLWNKVLQDDGLNGIEAVTVHYYPSVKKIGFREAVRRGPVEFANMVTEIRKAFPSKQIWLTEWNLGQPVSIPEFNSLYHSIFNMKMLASFLKTGVDVTCYHILAGRGWELLGPDKLVLNYKDSTEAYMLRRVPYFAFQLFNEAYKDATRFQVGRINNLEYIIFSREESLSIVGWSTKTGRDSIKLKGAEKYDFINGMELHGDTLLCSNGNVTRWREEKNNLPWKEKCKLKKLNQSYFTGPGVFKLDFRLSF